MKKYFIKNDEVIHAESPFQFVTELRQGSWFDSDCTDEEYMKNFAGRYKISSGIDMKYSNAEEFLNILIETGFVRKIEE
ncbi:MAG: hypothetical protein LBV41_01495 [Cytophagaceae bacterium]|jgi:hypothetical protein|nr:hypothetical protein [Cytophagaceae bacterium]